MPDLQRIDSRTLFEATMAKGERLLKFTGGDLMGTAEWTDSEFRYLRAWLGVRNKRLTIHKMAPENMIEKQSSLWPSVVSNAKEELMRAAGTAPDL